MNIWVLILLYRECLHRASRFFIKNGKNENELLYNLEPENDPEKHLNFYRLINNFDTNYEPIEDRLNYIKNRYKDYKDAKLRKDVIDIYNETFKQKGYDEFNSIELLKELSPKRI